MCERICDEIKPKGRKEGKDLCLTHYNIYIFIYVFTCLLHDRADFVDNLQVEGDGLLAKDGLARAGGFHDLVGVLVSGGADEHSVHFRVSDEVLVVLHVLGDAVLVADLLGTFLPDVGHLRVFVGVCVCV